MNLRFEPPVHNIFFWHFYVNLILCCDNNAGISLRKRNDRLKVSEITVEMPVDLALEMFIETGDLPEAKYPPLEELAEIITQALNAGDETQSSAPLEAILCGAEKQK